MNTTVLFLVVVIISPGSELGVGRTTTSTKKKLRKGAKICA